MRTCHRRGAHAIGGMAAFIPSRDPQVNRIALDKVRADKEREAGDGFDGSWVAHPGLVPACRDPIRHRARRPAAPGRAAARRGDGDRRRPAGGARTPGEVTHRALRNNIAWRSTTCDAWLAGIGAVAIFDLMEDAATAEIARCQVWQWIHHGTPLAGGGTGERRNWSGPSWTRRWRRSAPTCRG